MYEHRDRTGQIEREALRPVVAVTAVLGALWLAGFAAGYGAGVPAWAVAVALTVVAGAAGAGPLLARISHGGGRAG